ncbi:MAG: hypothetical protein MHM6MM_001756 [Cercozoa sp. M6MM]
MRGVVRRGARSFSNVLQDTHGRFHDSLRISLTERCNLRCRYCMPEQGVDLTPTGDLLTRDELSRLTRLFVSAGVQKIRLTGGEPLVRRDLCDIVSDINDLRSEGVETIAMTTNGVVLARRLDALLNAGLDGINMSLDTLRPDRFEQMSRRPRAAHGKIMSALDDAVHAVHEGRLRSLKLNNVVMRGINDDEAASFAALAETLPIHVRFIEFMPFDSNKWHEHTMVPHAELLSHLRRHRLVGGDGERLILPEQTAADSTARVYKVRDVHTGTEWSGRIGLISSMTKSFCGGCSRLRLTADGALKTCLFGSDEVSLRDAMRLGSSDSELLHIIDAAVNNKAPGHAGDCAKQEPSYDHDRRLNQWAAPVSTIASSISSSDSSGDARSSDNSTLISDRNSTGLTHVDATTGLPTMVDVSQKRDTVREACARSVLSLPRHVFEHLGGDDQDGQLELVGKKGPVFATAIIAGTQAAKQTWQLLPFCHQLPIDKVGFAVHVLSAPSDGVVSDGTVDIAIDCTVKTTHRTGVEMEAFVGASMAALAAIDMTKALSARIVVRDTRLLWKTGGKRDFHHSGTPDVV